MNNGPTLPVARLLNLRGRRALVTGASGNIGGAIARRLAEAGAVVSIHYFSDAEAAGRLANEIGAREPVQADLSRGDDIERLLDATRPELIVNNAAVQPVAAIAEITLPEWRRMHAINLDGAFLITRVAAAGWQAAGVEGAIVNIASIEAVDPAPGHAHYATAKAGLLMLTRASAVEFGGAGIRINAVSPGLVDRPTLAAEWPDGVARWLGRVPLERLGSAMDVADAVLFLLSPAARFITGVNLVVDGGMSARSRW